MKDLGSFLLLVLLSFVHDFHILGGKRVSEPPGMASGHRQEKGAGQKASHTSAESENIVRKMITPGKMHLVNF